MRTQCVFTASEETSLRKSWCFYGTITMAGRLVCYVPRTVEQLKPVPDWLRAGFFPNRNVFQPHIIFRYYKPLKFVSKLV